LTPNEGRARLNLGPMKGGGTPYLQQQNWSLADLDERSKNPILTPPTQTPVTTEPEEADEDDVEAAFAVMLRKELELSQ
jgi:hypothetical protein